jgi:S-DNA-T family DNA segregation ATPase FtsK/SpoIIIE
MKKKSLKKYKKEVQKEIRQEGDITEEKSYLKPETKNSIFVVLVFLLIIVILFSLFGWAGGMGQAINTGLQYLFGWGKFVFPFILFVLVYLLIQPKRYILRLTNYIGLFLLILSYSGFLHLTTVTTESAVSDISEGRGGGYIGLILSYPLVKAMGHWLAGVVLVFLFIVSLLILFDVSLKKLYERGNIFKRMAERFREFFYKLRENMASTSEDTDFKGGEEDQKAGEADFGVKPIEKEAEQPKEIVDEVSSKQGENQQMKMFSKGKKVVRKIDIPVDLLESSSAKPTSGDVEATKEKIYKTLKNFGIEAEMGDIKVGPTVTQYSLKPAEGVKLSQITTLNNDLALALAAHPIRIEAPIPGKSLVGIEVPNQAVAVVKLKEVITSREFKKRKSKLTISLGKDVAGYVWLADLDPMPHLLIAGATGSGKSVCLNSILISLLYQNSPDELKLILIDPKRVEMTVYNDIPHLITPVVNEINKTVSALRWVVAEMDRRFQLLSKTGHRDIHSFNRDNGDIMPYLVVAIDELADLMTVAANEVEGAIIRLAQMARAVGIHLILATQRPSVDIITGLIKANITSRIAFSVASAVDSRTILDTSGAEKLLGRGDMLYVSPQLSKPKRLQGAYVTDQEISRVLSFLKSKGKPEYEEEVVAKVIDKTLVGGFDDMGDDELVEQAKDLVIKAGKASASLLQRRLRVGYARAARLLDILEERGVIGPGEGAKPREILINQESVLNIHELGEPVIEDDSDQEENNESKEQL